MHTPTMNTVESIMTSARTEFAQYGFDGARVDRIASRAGVNKAMIYYHFRSKAELYRTLVDNHLKKIRQLAEHAMSGELTPDVAFRRLSELYHSMFEEDDNFMPVFLREVAGGSQRIRAVLDQMISERKTLVQKARKAMDKGKRSGSFRKVDTRHTIISFMGMNLGYLIMAPLINSIWEIKDDRKFRKERPRQVADLFLHGLEVRKE